MKAIEIQSGKYSKSILVLIMLLLYCKNQGQTAISFTSAADAYIDQANTTTNYGTSNIIYTYPWSTSSSRRSVIKFDLTPLTGVTIVSAYLVLQEIGTFGITRTVNFHRITTNWTESTVTWNSPWTTAGGDYNSSVSGTFSAGYPGLNKDSVNVTSDVQAFVNLSASNYGWLVKDSLENTSQNWWSHGTKEHATTTNRPVLRIVYSGSPLPVELVSFNTSCDNGKIHFEWITASEKNNDYFLIENSEDGQNWKTLHKEKGAGTSNSKKIYNYSHLSSEGKMTYYRLKQVDFNGEFEYSKIAVVSDECDFVDGEIGLYPNPAGDEVFYRSLEMISAVKSYDSYGHTTSLPIIKDKIDLSQLNSGVYNLSLTSASGRVYFKKLIKK